MNHIEKEKLIRADIASIENRVRHAFNQGYDLGFKDGKKRAKPIEQEPQSFKWCTDCKEYDQEKHCCHRWSKVIRDTVEEMKQESVIDKIRENHERHNCYMSNTSESNYGMESLLLCVQKHNSESK